MHDHCPGRRVGQRQGHAGVWVKLDTDVAAAWAHALALELLRKQLRHDADVPLPVPFPESVGHDCVGRACIELGKVDLWREGLRAQGKHRGG